MTEKDAGMWFVGNHPLFCKYNEIVIFCYDGTFFCSGEDEYFIIRSACRTNINPTNNINRVFTQLLYYSIWKIFIR